MRTDFTIITAQPWHCGQIARKLRNKQRDVVTRVGLNTHRELRDRFDDSFFRRAWLIDGQLAAIGGVTGTYLSSEGFVWLAFTALATCYPVEIVKEARRQIAEIMVTKTVLTTSILDDDAASRRLAIFLGFVPMDGGSCVPAASRYGRREILRRCAADGPARSVRNGAHVISMAYVPQLEAA